MTLEDIANTDGVHCNRRNFLRYLGYATSAALLPSCGDNQQQKKEASESCDLNAISKESLKEFYSNIEWKPFLQQDEYTHQRSILQGIHGFENILNAIGRDSLTTQCFLRYLEDNGMDTSTGHTITGDKTISAFLLHIGVANDDQGNTNGLEISHTAFINMQDVVDIIPELSGLNLVGDTSIQVYLIRGKASGHGMQVTGKVCIFLDEVIADRTNSAANILLNEVTAIVFDSYEKKVAGLQAKEQINQSNIKVIPLDENNQSLKEIIPHNTLNTQWSEYWGDLVNLSVDPKSNVRHMLGFSVILQGIAMTANSTNVDWESQSLNYINSNYPTYLLSKSNVCKFLLSEKFLSSINTKDGNLWEIYQKLIQDESHLQFSQRKIDEAGYTKIADYLAPIISQNTKALCDIQKYANNQLSELNTYLNSFTQ